MKIVVNPEYECLCGWLAGVPCGGYGSREVFRKFRNVVQLVEVDGYSLVIKKYKRPTIANCLVYTWFRHSKARRSYEYAFRLRELGIDTAAPVAYIETKRFGFFHTGYYVSSFIADRILERVDEYEEGERLLILDDFARFTVSQHERGVVHYDYNSGNIFFRREGAHYRFSLIDINRLRFGKVSKRDCIRCLKTMQMSFQSMAYVITRYAELRGWDPALLCGAVFLERGINIPSRFKRRILKPLLHKIKGLWSRS